MNLYAVIILAALLGEFALSVVSSVLNLRALNPILPAEFEDVFDPDRYAHSQQYTRSQTKLELVRSSVSLVAVVAVWQFGGFEWLDRAAQDLGFGSILTGLIYIGSLGLGATVLGLPFRLYSTFVIESRYGFNRTTLPTFVADFAKGIVLAVVLGGTLMTAVLFFFQLAGASAWLWCWLTATIFVLIVQFIAPIWIMPLFNAFTPLDAGELRTAIMSYAKSTAFPLKGIFVVDGSKRSSKANAFFSGLGKNKRIGLFDTLIDKHSIPELVAVVAHEVGHYKKGHITKSLVLQIGYLGAVFFVLSFVLQQVGLFEAFYMTEMSVHAGLVFFGLLFTPVDLTLSMYVNAVSRKNEFEADAFAASTTGNAEHLVTAFKKLSADSLSNLTPHPLHVFLHDSHPPVLQRIAALRASPSQ